MCVWNVGTISNWIYQSEFESRNPWKVFQDSTRSCRGICRVQVMKISLPSSCIWRIRTKTSFRIGPTSRRGIHKSKSNTRRGLRCCGAIASSSKSIGGINRVFKESVCKQGKKSRSCEENRRTSGSKHDLSDDSAIRNVKFCNIFVISRTSISACITCPPCTLVS